MYLTDIRHLQDAFEKMRDDMPDEPREILGFIKLITDQTSRILPRTLTETGISCFQKGCEGIIKTSLKAGTEDIHWYCPVCEKEGLINNWKGTEWDHREIIPG